MLKYGVRRKQKLCPYIVYKSLVSIIRNCRFSKDFDTTKSAIFLYEMQTYSDNFYIVSLV